MRDAMRWGRCTHARLCSCTREQVSRGGGCTRANRPEGGDRTRRGGGGGGGTGAAEDHPLRPPVLANVPGEATGGDLGYPEKQNADAVSKP